MGINCEHVVEITDQLVLYIVSVHSVAVCGLNSLSGQWCNIFPKTIHRYVSAIINFISSDESTDWPQIQVFSSHIWEPPVTYLSLQKCIKTDQMIVFAKLNIKSHSFNLVVWCVSFSSDAVIGTLILWNFQRNMCSTKNQCMVIVEATYPLVPELYYPYNIQRLWTIQTFHLVC